jgi:hypothetical protein
MGISARHLKISGFQAKRPRLTHPRLDKGPDSKGYAIHTTWIALDGNRQKSQDACKAVVLLQFGQPVGDFFVI